MLGKKNIQNLALGLGFLLSATAFAQGDGVNNTAATVPTGKVGIVRIQEAILSTNEGKKEAEALNQRFGQRSNDLKAQGEAFEKDKATLQAQIEKLSDEEKNNRMKQMTDRQKTLNRQMQDFQDEVQGAEQDIVNRIGEKMLKVLEKFSQTKGYAVILDVSNPQTPVLWFNQATDITKELVEAYNAESGVAPPAATPKTGGAAAPTRPAGTTGGTATRPPATGGTTPKKPQ